MSKADDGQRLHTKNKTMKYSWVWEKPSALQGASKTEREREREKNMRILKKYDQQKHYHTSHSCGNVFVDHISSVFSDSFLSLSLSLSPSFSPLGVHWVFPTPWDISCVCFF